MSTIFFKENVNLTLLHFLLEPLMFLSFQTLELRKILVNFDLIDWLLVMYILWQLCSVTWFRVASRVMVQRTDDTDLLTHSSHPKPLYRNPSPPLYTDL